MEFRADSADRYSRLQNDPDSEIFPRLDACSREPIEKEKFLYIFFLRDEFSIGKE